MNCRRTRSLLSAYVDAELTGFDMLQIRDHISRCSECSSEHASLVAMKRILSALPDKEPRPEFVFHLENMAPRHMFDEMLLRVMPMWMVTATSTITRATLPIGGRRVATACLFGLVGVWFMLAPTAITPQSRILAGPHFRSVRLMNAVGFSSPYSFVGARDASMTSMVDNPIQWPNSAGNSRLEALQARLLAETRSENLYLMIRPRFNAEFAPRMESSQEFAAPNVVLTGYSTASR